MAKERLDKILTDRGYFETKSKAQSAIMAGDVKINDIIVTKAGTQISPETIKSIEIKSMPFVSRGGFKLDKAINTFNVDIKNRICLDAGASTGGFTDCLLQNGAKYVYAVDVGYGQIAWKLRVDERVKVIERVNIKNCSKDEIYECGFNDEKLPDLAVMDLSFISITKVLPNIIHLIKEKDFEIIALIKPQFEAGKEEIGKNGVVRDKNIHKKVVKEIFEFAKSINICVNDFTVSPIKGPAGNTEYLVLLSDKKYNIIDLDYAENIIKEVEL